MMTLGSTMSYLLTLSIVMLVGAGCSCPERVCDTTAPRARTAAVPASAGVTTRTLPFVLGTAIPLPKPRTAGGLGLYDSLRARRSSRAYSPKPLPLTVLSNLLWATAGVNRPASGKRTVPFARNKRDTDVYVATEAGLYVYDADHHALLPKAKRDLRATTGKQGYVAAAPVNLVFVADWSRMTRGDEKARMRYAGAHAAFMSQNVYLFCAAEGLATVVRASFDAPALGRALGLSGSQLPVLAQTIGYPAPRS